VDASSCPASSTAMARAAILSAAPEGEAIAGRWLTGYGLLVRCGLWLTRLPER
jgi:hypothetical protein